MRGGAWLWLVLVTACGASTTRNTDDRGAGGGASGQAGASIGVATGGSAGSGTPPEAKGCDASLTVTIADPVLAASIHDTIGLTMTAPIPLAEAEPLRALHVATPGVASLDGLECFTGLQTLSIVGGTFDDLRPISGLPLLRTLSLTSGQVSEMSALAALKQLDWLYLDGNLVVDVAPLAQLPKLFNLSLAGNQVRDVTPLLRLLALGELILDGNPIDCNDPTQSAAIAELESRIADHPPPEPHPGEVAARGFYGPCNH